MTDTQTPTGRRLYGDWVRPVNRWQGAENSIHTDSVAQKIGMRGGTIPGTVHLTHFPAILDDLFGDRWRAEGGISMFYTYATTDGEPVRAFVEEPPPGARDVQLIAGVENEAGVAVCKGSVSVGRPATPSYVRATALENAAPGESRILAAMSPGMEVTPVDRFIIDEEAPDEEITDPQKIYRALAVFPEGVNTKPAVGFFGATDLALRAGPLRSRTPYRKTGRVICVGQSAKTEFAWYDSELHDQDGRLIAQMRHMTRWMKISSPLWAA